MNFRRKLQAGLIKPFRSKAYRDYVSSLECPCGNPADDPSHVNVGHYKGMGTKAPDLFIWPSCRICHCLYETDRERWRELYGDEWEWVALTLAQAREDGVITL